ncbi:hypothetical protein MCOR27_008528 [Pyricularia oryzae]|uniref:1-phosphatidylinositol-3-phosphate 5-kinase n=1 Tax=Pyricularia grisea TaxID=148305 RepID=A0ABQ8NDS5_PYRGI|nr:hypothetical protein MCOR01_010825 [Pyricularia oryzae]KAI6295413.1 hypothetical protein MCOR33_007689 [Pyricularia grisea]KAI6255429.1 hypothetical protein MCOR19_008083 [Pyricularia oryzae]KAI6272064.1 hypothetical protein MCOR27_008528 [Pyricularia oryzae]KAI6278834.1 hypothetical protein MCOR26_004486 [Pyricularia oryzae]
MSSSANNHLRARRGSLASISTASQIDKEQLAQALDQIHTSASQSDVLTTFNDFAAPPSSSPTSERKGGAGDLVQQGLSGLYSRLKEAVGVKSPELSLEDVSNVDAASKNTSGSTSGSLAIKSPATSLPRTSSTATASTLLSAFPDGAQNPPTSPHVGTSVDGTAHDLRSSKASSVATAAAPKSTSSSMQNLPRMSKTVASSAVVNPSLAPITVSAFRDKDAARGVTTRVEDAPQHIRVGSSSKSSEAHTTVLSGTINSLESSDVKYALPGSSRRDESLGPDEGSDSRMSPVRGSAASVSTQHSADRRSLRAPSTEARASSRESLRRPAVIDRISQARIIGVNRARAESLEPGMTKPSTISTSAHNSVYHDSFARHEQPQQLPSGKLRIPGTTTNEGAPQTVNARLESMRKQVVSKEFWMADETCKECFLCGNPFSAFRRKHHCRTCGCIFDSKCTSTISGAKFGVSGSLRVCKTCLEIINRRYDSGSDDSDNDSYLPAIFRSGKDTQTPRPRADDEVSIMERAEDVDDSRSVKTPMMAIPATRRIGDSKILEIDAPQLSRPSSSRSLRSLAGRPISSGHRRNQSKSNFLGRFKATAEERAPFRRPIHDELGRKTTLPAFHDDNIIDPELEPYMSEESSGDEQMSIFATMASSDVAPASLDPDKANFGPLLSTGKRHRMRQGEKSISGLSFTSRGPDDGAPIVMGLSTRPTRRRNMSTASTAQPLHGMRSPRPRSGVFGRGFAASGEALASLESPIEATKLTRSDSIRNQRSDENQLSPSSLKHVTKLLHQLLQDDQVPNADAWEKALLPILTRCADDVSPDSRNQDHMDIRHYVKLKRIPGAKPGDTSYVSGVIFSKNLALKNMPRSIVNPRIVIISFPIEYQRHQQHFMSLQPVIEQEKEYLRVVVSRIMTLRPQVLLAERSVAGVALQYLSEANVAVAYNVKPSVIGAVSRCAKASIISSLDMLALPVHVGQAAGFEVKTFVNKEIPGKKKTYIFISGCERELGCTIALRGAKADILTRMKRITEFMVYVVYNLKLESCLMRDEFIKLPEADEQISQNSESQDQPDEALTLNCCELAAAQTKEVTASQDVQADVDQGNETSQGSTTGAQPSVLPDGDDQTPKAQGTEIEQAQERTPRLISLHEHHSHVGNDSPLPEDVPMPTYYSEMIAKYETKILSASPFVRFPQPYLLMKAREQERRLSYLKRLCDQDMVEEQTEAEKTKPARFQLIKPEMVHQFGHKAPRQVMEVLHAVHDAEYDKARYIYETQTRHWENYLQGNIDLFDPYSHQNIVVLYSVICTDTKIPCSGPGLVAIGFYDEHPDPSGHMDPDCTLGQYIEDLSMSSTSICHANGCDRPMWQHHRTYVHEDARITVFIEKDTPLPSGVTLTPVDDDIYMWNYCKSCKKDIGVMVMSDSSWKYSFGKYLELSFWGKGLHLHPGSGCTHDHQKEHIRYFNFRGNTIRIHWDPIDLLEIIVPRARITWKVEHDLKLKNDIFLKCEERWTRFINSVKTRLKSIRIDSVLPDKSELCKSEVERLTKKAQEDLPELIRKLQDAYMNSKYYEVIPMNPVFREMLERVQEWDAAFAKFEADFLSDKDVRQLTMIQLKKMFGDNDSKESLPTDATSIISVSSEGDEKASLTTTQATIPEELDEKPECQSTEVVASVTTVAASDAQSQTTDSAPLNDEGAADQRQVNALLGAVEPLDLATPRAHTRNRSDTYFPEGIEGASREISSSNDSESNTPTPAVPIPTVESKTAEAQTKSAQGSASSTSTNSAPLLAVKVEQLRKDFRTLSGETSKVVAAAAQAQAEQQKYVMERGSSRRAGLTVSPPMVRALSQSSLPFTRLPSGITKSPVLLDSKANESSIGSELSRVPTESSTKSEKKLSERLGISALKVHRKAGQSSIPRYVHGKKKDSRVSVLAKHFEQLSREFEKERMKDRKQRAAKMHYSRAFLPRTSTKATVEVYQDVDQAVKELGHEEEQGNEGPRAVSPTVVLKEQPEKPSKSPTMVPEQATERNSEETTPENGPSQTDTGSVHGELEDTRPGESQTGSDDEGGSDADQSSLLDDILMPDEPTDDMPKNTKTSLMKMLTNFWAERSASGWSPLEYPFNATDHIFIDSDVVVREDEPSSLIAFALSSTDYQAKLADIRRSWKTSSARRPDTSEDIDPTLSNDVTVVIDSDPAAVLSDTATDIFTDEAELEKSLKRSTGTHLKYQFTEGSAKLLCKIFYAEQFDALRRKCNVADRIIESLSRCLKWDSRGGKTRSVFLKTLDDRLVMKSLSPIETQAFLKFAPSYFNIMAEALFHDLPSVIAKMLGFFQIIIKNPMTNTEIKLDLLVMENLFYDRSPDRIFDLKGSMRNRKIQSTGEQNEVLLDENMVEYIYESPLFAREHSKKILSASVWNDTLFLARQNVMDYSLMVAVDEARKELVVGIIDCIRTYTWDKKLESWIKDRGFAGGGRNRPTVTSPKEYKSRFREAMARYILQAPNCWHQFGNSVMMSGHGHGRTTRFEDVAD